MVPETNFMNAIEQEHYSFGPWLVKIKKIEDIPPQYLLESDLILSADFAFKVPIEKDRLMVEPGSVLYNKVILIEELKMIVFSAEDNQEVIKKEEIYFNEIDYIVRGAELLNSYMIFACKNQTYKIKYNTVSEEIAIEAVILIRDRIPNRNNKYNIEKTKNIDTSKLLLYFNFTKNEVSTESISVVEYKEEKRFTIFDLIKFELNSDNLKRYRLNEILTLKNELELIFVIRGNNDFEILRNYNYAYRNIFIRLDKIRDIKTFEHDKYKSIKTMRIELENNIIEFNVDTDYDLIN